MTTLLWIAGFLFAGYVLGGLAWVAYLVSKGFPLGAALYIAPYWPLDVPERLKN